MGDEQSAGPSAGELTVRVFGMQAQSIGADQVTLTDVLFPLRVSDALTQIAGSHPALSDSIRTSRLAVNHEFAEPQTLIQRHDEVALVGLISGG